LTTSATPKAANGATATPKSTKAAESKSAKSKSKKKDADDKKAEEAAAAKEPELSAEDKHVRKSVCDGRSPESLGSANAVCRKRFCSSGTRSRRAFSRGTRSPRRRR
jgi:hypothetical protein